MPWSHTCHLPRNTAGSAGGARELRFSQSKKAQFVTVKSIIFENSRRDYVENRDRLLRGLTLHRSGREPDG